MDTRLQLYVVVWLLNNGYIVVFLPLCYSAINVLLFTAEKWLKSLCLCFWLLVIFEIASTHNKYNPAALGIPWHPPPPPLHLWTMCWWLLGWQWVVHCLLVVMAPLKRPAHRWINAAKHAGSMIASICKDCLCWGFLTTSLVINISHAVVTT